MVESVDDCAGRYHGDTRKARHRGPHGDYLHLGQRWSSGSHEQRAISDQAKGYAYEGGIRVPLIIKVARLGQGGDYQLRTRHQR